MSKCKTIVLTLAIAGACGLGGCAQVSPWMAQNNMMSKDMMNSQGDMLIREGQKMKSDAAAMKDGEFNPLYMRTKDQLMSDGEKEIRDGQMMKTKAAS